MSSVIDICNLALSNIRAGSINSLTEGSVQAQLCSLKYPLLLDHMLEQVPWQFNHKMIPLVMTEHKIFNYNYAYAYPSDCTHINRLVGEYEEIDSDGDSQVSRLRDDQLRPLGNFRQQIPYEIFTVDFMGERVIASNELNLRIDYRADAKDPVNFSADFTLALSHLLAAEIAVAIVGGALGASLRKESLSIYTAYLSDATATDLNELYPQEVESPYVSVRK